MNYRARRRWVPFADAYDGSEKDGDMGFRTKQKIECGAKEQRQKNVQQPKTSVAFLHEITPMPAVFQRSKSIITHLCSFDNICIHKKHLFSLY